MAVAANAFNNEAKLDGYETFGERQTGYVYLVDAHRALAAVAAEVYVFVVMVVILGSAGIAAESEFHDAAVVGHLVNEPFFVESAEGAVEGDTVETVRQLHLQLGLRNGTGVLHHKIEHRHTAIGEAQIVLLKQFPRLHA